MTPTSKPTSAEVVRYEPIRGAYVLAPGSTGGFVRAEDYEALQRRIEALEAVDAEIRETLFNALDRDRDGITTSHLAIAAANAMGWRQQEHAARVEALEADAARYRWLKTELDLRAEDGVWWLAEMPTGYAAGFNEAWADNIDAAIDAAMHKGEGDADG